MDNNRKMMIFMAITWIAVLFFMLSQRNKSNLVDVSKPATIEQVQLLEEKAGTDKKALGGIIKQYYDIAKKNSGTEIDAQAKMQVARIKAEKLKDENGAVREYQTIVKAFPYATSPTGKEAQDKLTVLLQKVDAKNSTQFGYKFIDWLVATTGKQSYSYTIALLIFAILVKLVTLPLTQKQYQSMKEMRKIQPLMKQVQEKYKGDQQEIAQRTMALYKEHGISPFASCLPMIIQMPIMFLLYIKVILAYQFQFTNGTFLWIGSDVAQGLTGFTLFGFKLPLLAANLAQPDLPLLVLYTASMILTSKLTPSMDPSQAEQQKMMTWGMPIMFGVMFLIWSFPSAFMLYWFFSNVLNTTHQYFHMKNSEGDGTTPTATSGSGGGNSEPVPAMTAKSGKTRQRGKKRFDLVKREKPVCC